LRSLSSSLTSIPFSLRMETSSENDRSVCKEEVSIRLSPELNIIFLISDMGALRFDSPDLTKTSSLYVYGLSVPFALTWMYFLPSEAFRISILAIILGYILS